MQGLAIGWSLILSEYAFDSEVLMMIRPLLVNSLSFVRAVIRRVWIVLVTLLLLPATSLAQSPWERAAANLEASFTGPLARSLALVAIVIGGLMFMFGEGGAKRQISGIVFGVSGAGRKQAALQHRAEPFLRRRSC